MTVLLQAVTAAEIVAEETAAAGLGGLMSNARKPYVWLRRSAALLMFERRYGVRTADFVSLEDFGLAHRDRVYYSPANWRTLSRALPRHEVGGHDVFLDFGSGMGRMVLEAASRYSFARVIGVELSAQLNDIARTNLARTRLRMRSRAVELVRSDALDFAIPDDVSVVFFNNPFRGPVFATVIRNLIASVDRNPRRVRVVYFNPVESDFLLGTGRFRLTRTVPRRWRRRGDSPFGETRVYEITERPGA
jgi:hypothetical protein